MPPVTGGRVDSSQSSSRASATKVHMLPSASPLGGEGRDDEDEEGHDPHADDGREETKDQKREGEPHGSREEDFEGLSGGGPSHAVLPAAEVRPLGLIGGGWYRDFPNYWGPSGGAPDNGKM
jgi:hypothetical protein